MAGKSDHANAAEENRRHRLNVGLVEAASGPMLALSTEYPDGHTVPEHQHSRSQLLHALTGVVLVISRYGRWMVPPDHAMWIPAGIDHAVEMLGNVSMRSIYVEPSAIADLPERLKVVAMPDLMRSLIIEATRLPQEFAFEGRNAHLVGLLLHEIPRLPERPLGLPMPHDARLLGLCRQFVAQPTTRLTINDWAEKAGMSRRTFTRAFQKQSGVSLSTWRQQAILFAALPRLADGEAITSVAIDLGYDSVPAFTTMFKRMLGTAPRDYMRSAGEARS